MLRQPDNFQRILAVFLAVSCGLPSPAHALPEPRENTLRVSQPRNSPPVAGGLEDRFSAGLEEKSVSQDPAQSAQLREGLLRGKQDQDALFLHTRSSAVPEEFQQEVRRRRGKYQIFGYLWRLWNGRFGEQADPRPALIEWHANRTEWRGLHEASRLEIVRWLATLQRNEPPPPDLDLFGFFKEIAGDPKEWMGTRTWALTGMSRIAQTPAQRHEILSMTQAFWREALDLKDRRKGPLLKDLRRIVEVDLRTDEALKWYASVSQTPSAGLEEDDGGSWRRGGREDRLRRVVELNRQGAGLRKMGRLEEAAGLFDEALVIFPNDSVTLANKANILIQLGRYSEGEELAARAVSANPRDFEGYFSRADARRRQGKLAEALADVNEGIRLAPGRELGYRIRAEVHIGLGDVLRKLEEYERAAEDATSALGIKPVAHAYRLRARARLGLGRPEEALPDIEEFLKAKPSNGDGLRLRSRILEALSVRSLEVEAGKAVKAARSLRSGRRWEEALAVLKEAVQKFPQKANLRGMLADTYTQLGRCEDAVRTAEEGLKLFPEDTRFYIRLAEPLVLSGKKIRARSVLARGLIKFPESGLLRAALNRLGRSEAISRPPAGLEEMDLAQLKEKAKWTDADELGRWLHDEIRVGRSWRGALVEWFRDGEDWERISVSKKRLLLYIAAARWGYPPGHDLWPIFRKEAWNKPGGPGLRSSALVGLSYLADLQERKEETVKAARDFLKDHSIDSMSPILRRVAWTLANVANQESVHLFRHLIREHRFSPPVSDVRREPVGAGGRRLIFNVPEGPWRGTWWVESGGARNFPSFGGNPRQREESEKKFGDLMALHSEVLEEMLRHPAAWKAFAERRSPRHPFYRAVHEGLADHPLAGVGNPPAAGLEESVARAMAVLAEAAVGPGAVAIDAAVFPDHAGLEELVKRLPLRDRVVVVGDPADGFLEEIRARNPEVRWASGLEEAVTTLLSMAPADRVQALGPASFTEGLANGLGLFGIPVSPLEMGAGLRAFLLAVGLEESVLEQIDLDSAQRALKALEAA